MKVMHHLRIAAAVGIIWMTFDVGAAQALYAPQKPTILESVGLDQKLGSQAPLDLQFADESGARVRLGDYFGEKPVILTLVYYECPMLCTLILNGTVRALRTLEFSAGQEFEIVTVSIDPGETPALAAQKRAEYLDIYRREGAESGWHFLTGEEEQIRALAESVGFSYKYDRGDRRVRPPQRDHGVDARGEWYPVTFYGHREYSPQGSAPGSRSRRPKARSAPSPTSLLAASAITTTRGDREVRHSRL
jgi:cytochrome oxidase Cu insertion factor (SCO1/SenC/PrrC family)